MNKLFVIVTGLILGAIIVAHNPPSQLLSSNNEDSNRDAGPPAEQAQPKGSAKTAGAGELQTQAPPRVKPDLVG